MIPHSLKVHDTYRRKKINHLGLAAVKSFSLPKKVNTVVDILTLEKSWQVCTIQFIEQEKNPFSDKSKPEDYASELRKAIQRIYFCSGYRTL